MPLRKWGTERCYVPWQVHMRNPRLRNPCAPAKRKASPAAGTPRGLCAPRRQSVPRLCELRVFQGPRLSSGKCTCVGIPGLHPGILRGLPGKWWERGLGVLRLRASAVGGRCRPCRPLARCWRSPRQGAPLRQRCRCATANARLGPGPGSLGCCAAAPY